MVNLELATDRRSAFKGRDRYRPLADAAVLWKGEARSVFALSVMPTPRLELLDHIDSG